MGGSMGVNGDAGFDGHGGSNVLGLGGPIMMIDEVPACSVACCLRWYDRNGMGKVG